MRKKDFIAVKMLSKERKFHFLIILMIMCLALASLSFGASYTNAPKIKVTLSSQSPDPVEPGQTVKLKFKVEKNGLK